MAADTRCINTLLLDPMLLPLHIALGYFKAQIRIQKIQKCPGEKVMNPNVNPEKRLKTSSNLGICGDE
uniref:Uncharacterized protein n=1 Tax=Timema tahoe TaxID=61484 RepID=A0A7R9NVQ3_9NEOP|nr:unnamed protein product [Timema tahoe]